MKYNSNLGIIARGWNPKEPSNKTNFFLIAEELDTCRKLPKVSKILNLNVN